MKIELWYDAVVQETDILINNIPVEKNDIYGFLYSVRNYPIQSWLYPTGSWKGIEYQLTDLARDEHIDLVFNGRKCDFEDLQNCLCKNQNINLSFIEWDICQRYDELFSKLLSTLKSNDDIINASLSAILPDFEHNVNFGSSDSELDWAYNIYNDDDLLNFNNDHGYRCCYVHDSYFTAYEKLHDLLTLTRSLEIPADAIFCFFKDNQTKNDYQYYANAYKKMSFSFCEEVENMTDKAFTKYGRTSVVRQKIKKCYELCEELSAAYIRIKEFTQDDFIKFKKNIVSLNEIESENYYKIKHLRDNADKFRYGIDTIHKYIDTLLSVSKDNKDEVFHYECIDKFEENVTLYLNAKTLSEVN